MSMTFPPPTLLDSLSDVLPTDVLVVGVAKSADGPVVTGHPLDSALAEVLTAAAIAIGADGSSDKTWRIPAPEGCAASSVVLVGMGKDAITADTLRGCAGYAALGISGEHRRVFALPASSPTDIAAVIEGALLGSHRVTKHGATPAPKPPTMAVVGTIATDTLDSITAHCEAVWLVRDLVTMPPNFLNPVSFVEAIAERAKDLPLTVEILDEVALVEQGYGGISAVGKGSQNPPRLMVLRYEPSSPSRHIALVGKGITFDSGGLSLKPPTGMVGMKYDMTGAAVMAAATLAAASMGSGAQITTYLCLAENMPSGSASRPNDVITIKGGKTVEILNTDAEGRLVMADGLEAASALSPDLIIDVATLTGAARVALGERYAGLMGSHDAIAQVQVAAALAGELVWPMPMPSELRAMLASDVADIANVKSGESLGGMLMAAVFLKDFVGTQKSGEPIPWAHLDIAGPAANSSGPFGYTPKGATGAITRTIIGVLMA